MTPPHPRLTATLAPVTKRFPDWRVLTTAVNMASTVWRGHISFGLISVPVRLFRAARPERVNLRRVYRTEPPSEATEKSADIFNPVRAPGKISGIASSRDVRSTVKHESASSETQTNEPIFAPVQQAAITTDSAQVLPAKSVHRGYEYEKNRFVVVDPEELKSITPKTATEMEILEFVRLSEIDPIYFETSYYVKPERAGQKPYALLYRALQVSRLVALARFAMHNREHVIIVRPGERGLITHTLYFSSEVRRDEEYEADLTRLTAKELELANRLVESLAGPFEPEKYRDTYREQLENMIAAKVEGKVPANQEKLVRSERVINITDALQKSLAALKKPPQSAKQLSKASARKKTKAGAKPARTGGPR
jgi:DNA end-binding protein Ku